jgi:pyruvate/2-oxoacid:ferredoxin oxidoreductase beta subunit
MGVESYLKEQKRYRHLKPEQIARLQAETDFQWDRLRQRVAGNPA